MLAGAMFGLVVNGLRARRAQTLALFVLTVLAALGTSAAPWFLGWARDAVSVADLAAAPAMQRVVVVAGDVEYEAGAPSPATVLRERVRRQLDVPGSVVVAGARLYANLTRAGVANAPSAGLYLTSRDDVCAQLRLVKGACPTGPGDVMIGRTTAESLGLAVGDQVRLNAYRLAAPATLRVSGTYEVVDQLSEYWAGAGLLSGRVDAVSTVVDEPVYVSEQTLLAAAPNGLSLDVHLHLPPDAYHGQDNDLVDRLARATGELGQAKLNVTTGAPDLLAQIHRDQRLVALAVTVGSTQMMLLCWFVLFLAVRHTSDERRPDIGLLKLRGVAPWRIWSLTALQSAIPMLAGAVLGWAIGFLAAGVLTGGVSAMFHTTETDVVATVWLSVFAAALACLGALLVAVLAESRGLRSSVAVLLRRVPGVRRGWRPQVGDLIVVVLAGAGVYQGYAELRASDEPSLLALLAPALVGLAVALLAARALPLLAARVGAGALRAGRPGIGLTALHLARRPGTHRVFAVLAVSMAVLATATLFWHTATLGWADRAGQELGAQRVLTVRAANSTTLLAAVREVDPDGDFAMAVAGTEGFLPEDRLLAVDSSRLAAVAIAPSGRAMSDVDGLAGLLRRPTTPPPSVGDGPITVDLSGPSELGPDRPVALRLHLMTAGGGLASVDFGPLAPHRQTYQATVTTCPDTSCRLIAVEPVMPIQEVTAIRGVTPSQTTMELYGIAQPGRDVVPPSMLADITRWTGQVGALGVGNALSARDGRLQITPFTGGLPEGQRRDYRVFVVDAPAPLPVVLAGARPVAQNPGDERFTVMGTERVAYQVVATTSLLPRLGPSGALVDLEYAQRGGSRGAEAAILEVWLNSSAPPDVVARLSAAGIQVLTDQSVDDVANRLAEQGPGEALVFQLFAGGIVLLLAAGMMVITLTVERRARVEELTALRAQGLSEASMMVAGYAGAGALVVAAILTGLFAALLAQAVVAASMPIFADGWALLPLHRGPQPLPLTVAAIVALLILGAAAAAGSSRVVATVRGRPTRRRMSPALVAEPAGDAS